MATGLTGGRVPPVPVRLDARGAVGAAGAAGGGEARRAGAGWPRRRVHDGEGGRCHRRPSGGSLLADRNVSV